MFFVEPTNNLLKNTLLLRMCIAKNISIPLIVTGVLLPFRQSLAVMLVRRNKIVQFRVSSNDAMFILTFINVLQLLQQLCIWDWHSHEGMGTFVK
jgi:hypothetical protein